MTDDSDPQVEHDDSRREFIRGSSLLIASALPAGKRTSSDPPEGRRIRLGLIGCGRTGIQLTSQALRSPAAGTQLVALADMFGDRLQRAARNLKGRFPEQYAVVPQSRRVGPEAYVELAQRDVDLVIVASPPAFRPLHLEAALQAGKHVYVEQPIAIDVPGWQRVRNAMCQNENPRQMLAIGSQPYWPQKFLAVMDVLRAGRIGDLLRINATSALRLPRDPAQPRGQDRMEFELRNWRHCVRLRGHPGLPYHMAHLELAYGLLGNHPEAVFVESASEVSLAGFGEHCLRYEYAGGAPQLFSRCVVPERGQTLKTGIEVFGTSGRCEITPGKIYDLQGHLRQRVPSPGAAPSSLQSLMLAIANGQPTESLSATSCALSGILGQSVLAAGESQRSLA